MFSKNKFFFWALILPITVPLWLTPYTFFSWTFGKTILFQVCIELLVFIYLWSLLNRSTNGIWKAFKTALFGLDWLDRLVLAFGVVITITGLLGINPLHSWWGDQSRSNGIFTWWHFVAWFFLLKAHVDDMRSWRLVLAGASVVGVVVALSAWFQNVLPASWRSDFGSRFSGILGNPAFLASFLVIAFGCTLLALALLLSDKKDAAQRYQWYHGFLAAAAVFLLLTLFGTQIRGSILGLVGGVLVAGFLSPFLFTDKKIQNRAIVGVLFLLLVGALTVFIGQTTWLEKNFPEVEKVIDVRNFSLTTGETRLMAWGAAWRGFEDRPLAGWGWGNYEAIFSTYYNPRFLKFSFTETVWDKPHNWFLEIMDSSGVVGLGLYVGILVAAVAYSFKLVKRSVLSPAVGLVLIGTVVAYGVQNIFLFEITNTLVLFFLLLAFISSILKKSLSQNGPEEVMLGAAHRAMPENQKGGMLSGAIVFIMKGFLVISLVVSLWVGCFLPLKSSYYLQQAREPGTIDAWAENAPRSLAVPTYLAGESAVFLSEQFVRLERAGNPIVATSTVETAVLVAKTLHAAGQHSPRTIAYPAWASQVYMILGEHVDSKYYLLAKVELERAVAISPKKQDILFLLGRYYLLTKQFPEAIQVHKDALAADPSIGQSYWFLGLAYSASGNIAEALKNIELAEQKGFGLSRDQQLYVIDLYAHEKRYDDLIVQYKKLRDQEPDAVEWYVKLATAYALKGDKAAALQTVEEVLRLDPTIKESAEAFIKKYNLR